MARGPRTPDDIRIRVNEIFLDLRDQLGYEPSARVVLETLKEELEQLLDDTPLFPTPSQRQVQAILTIARKNLGRLGDLDRPWSLGVSPAYGIPDDAAGELLKAWGWCAISGKRFTIRQAQWANRLRWVVEAGGGLTHPGKIADPREVYKWACVYAARERAARIAGLPIDTRDMDASLALGGERGGEIYHAAVQTGVVPGWTLRNRLETLNQGDPELWHEWYRIEQGAQVLVEQFGGEVAATEAKDALEARLAQVPEHFREDALFVFGLWLRAFMNKATKWRSMSVPEHHEKMNALAEEIVAYFESGPDPYSRLSKRGSPYSPSDALLESVGYKEEGQQ